eukprot:679766-Rhodomonas_salina.1
MRSASIRADPTEQEPDEYQAQRDAFAVLQARMAEEALAVEQPGAVPAGVPGCRSILCCQKRNNAWPGQKPNTMAEGHSKWGTWYCYLGGRCPEMVSKRTWMKCMPQPRRCRGARHSAAVCSSGDD